MSFAAARGEGTGHAKEDALLPFEHVLQLHLVTGLILEQRNRRQAVANLCATVDDARWVGELDHTMG